ncbi:MAG: FtsW/RodA/SpoVE family cell cycle protein [Solobacterium sp.]|nr:FtsW/RodA/SpoVE family cell cycle protein [Solobacterium sp.]
MTTMEENTKRTSVFTRIRKAVSLPEGGDRLIHYTMIVLAIFGLLMMTSASMGLVMGESAGFYLMVQIVKQAVFLIAGYTFLLMISKWFHVDMLKNRYFFVIYMFMLVGLVACLAFPEQYGARAWIRIPLPRVDMSIQPSEFAKVVSILMIASYTGDIRKKQPRGFVFVMRPFLLMMLFVAIILIPQSDLGSAVVLFLISCVCLLVPNNRQMRPFQIVLKVLFWISLAAVIFVLTPYGESVIMTLPIQTYQKQRFLSAIDPFHDRYGSGFQLISGLISFVGGGWFGRGYGNSILKYSQFPAANSDFVLAIIVEELGFVGFLFLMALYFIIVFRLLHWARMIKNEKAKIILVGTAMYFLIHMIFNIGGVTALIPLTGVPLLMVSAGGSSTLSILICLGFAQAVIRAKNQGEIE